MHNIYQEIILDHYQNPRNFGELPDASEITKLENPSCGDVITMSVNIENDKIQDIRFQGAGCAISQASASMLTDFVKNKTLQEIQAINKDTILELLGIELGPTRLKCALLSLETLKKVVEKYETAVVSSEV